MAEYWWLLAILSSISMGAMIYVNQIFQMPSSLAMVYRGFVQSILLLPLFSFFEFPTHPWFWALCVLQGIFIAISDGRAFQCSKIYGGEITSSIKPYGLALVFILWLIIKPEQFFELVQTPKKFAVIILCLGAVIYSMRKIRESKISKAAFMMMLPALLASVCINVNNKYAITLGATTGLPSAIFYYNWITAISSGLPNFVGFVRHHNWRDIFLSHNLWGGFIIIVCILVGNVFKTSAMYYTYNPAYVSATMYLYPVWIILWDSFYYRKKDVKKFPRCNFVAIGILLVSVITLILIK